MAEAASSASRRTVSPVRGVADAPFYVVMGLISTALVFVGFAPSFYLKSVLHGPPPLSALTITHGVVFTAWFLVFLAQAVFISRGQTALHRRLGILSAILFGIVFTLGLSTAFTAARLGHAPPGARSPLSFIALPVISIFAALFLVAFALLARRSADWHKRLMLASLIMITGPGVFRIFIMLGLAPEASNLAMTTADVLLAAALFHDYLSSKRVHPANWLAAGAFAIRHVAVIWAFGSPLWSDFARLITQSPPGVAD